MADENEKDAENGMGSAEMNQWFRGRSKAYRLCAESVAERIASTGQLPGGMLLR